MNDQGELWINHVRPFGSAGALGGMFDFGLRAKIASLENDDFKKLISWISKIPPDERSFYAGFPKHWKIKPTWEAKLIEYWKREKLGQIWIDGKREDNCGN